MMKERIKSVVSIVLCSIVTILATSCSKENIALENEFKPVMFYTEDGPLSRWQEQLQWIADSFKIVFPELELAGWRNVGTLNSEEAINKFIEEGLQDNKLFGHTIDADNNIFEVAPRSELTQKYGVWGEEAIRILKRQLTEITPIGANIIELKWIYKGNKYLEKIAVSNETDIFSSAIKFNTISRFIYIKNEYVPKANWQIEIDKARELKAKNISPEIMNELIAKLKVNSTRTGIDGEEEQYTYKLVTRSHPAIGEHTPDGLPLYDILIHTITEFSTHDLAFRGWGKVIEKCNAAPNYCCDVDATLVSGELGISASATYKWGYAYGYGANSASVVVSGKYLNIYGLGKTETVTIVCEILEN